MCETFIKFCFNNFFRNHFNCIIVFPFERKLTIFICQDSDDEYDTPIEMPESFLLPAIHHAGLPEEIASRGKQYEETWKIGVNEFEQNLKRA